MKKDIHPNYHADAKIKCACGNVITAGSVKKETEVEICGQCHPFFSGREKLIDTAGRVEKFKQKLAKAKIIKATVKEKSKRTRKSSSKPG